MSKKQNSYMGPSNLKATYSEGSNFIQLWTKTLESDAYISMSMSSQLILIDLFRHIQQEFMFINPEKRYFHKFKYTYSDCKLTISPTTFKKSIKEIIEKGWLDFNISDKPIKVCSANYYRISERWKEYRMNIKEKQISQNKTTVKKKIINNDKNRIKELFENE